MNQDLSKKIRKYSKQCFEKWLKEISKETFWERLKLARRIIWA